MQAYSIEKRGPDFVVKSGQQDILKFSTKRLATQMIRDARLRETVPVTVVLVAERT